MTWEVLSVLQVPSLYGSGVTNQTGYLCVAVILALTLPPLWRWLRVWKTLRTVPGPSDTIPFRFLLAMYWARRRYINVDYATAGRCVRISIRAFGINSRIKGARLTNK